MTGSSVQGFHQRENCPVQGTVICFGVRRIPWNIEEDKLCTVLSGKDYVLMVM